MEKNRLVLWWVEARISAQPCLSGRRARSCGGGYWIQMRPVSPLRPLQVEMLLSIRSVRAWLRADPSHWWFQEPLAPFSSPRSPLINVWVTVVFPYWYLDWWRRSRSKPYWPTWKWYVSNCLNVFVHSGADTFGGTGDSVERWSAWRTNISQV